MTVHPRLNKALRIVAPWALLASLVACGWMEDLEENTEPAPAPVVAEPAPAAPAAEPAPAAGGGACSRVAGCCRAYIDAMGGSVPTSTCDAYNNVVGMPDATCESAIAGYRSGLTALNKTVPSECAP